MDKRFMNINILGLGFMFVLTSFFTVSNIEKTVLKSIEKDDPSFTGDGYTSLCIIYSVFAVFNWLAPVIIGRIGSCKSIYLGSICYIVFLTPFFWPSNVLLYVISAVLGFGGAILWTGQGIYLTLNSDSSTISRNSGTFWAMSKISICIGNAFIILVLHGKNELDKSARTMVFMVLAVVGAFGTLILIMLRPSIDATGMRNEVKQGTEKVNPSKELKNSMSLFLTKDMGLLSTIFFFSGLHVSLYTGVFCSCIAFTKSMGTNSKQLLGYTGIMIGVGEITGGLLCSFFGRKSPKSNDRKFNGLSRSTVIIISFFVNIIAYVLIFINLPNDSPFGDTQAKSIIKPNEYLAVFCGFLLGLGDSGYVTQIYNIIGVKYTDKITSAASLFMFVQSVSAAICFFYSNQFGLYMQLVILGSSMIIGTLSFLKVDKSLLV